MASVSTAPDDAPGDNPPEHELYDPFVDDEAAPSDYNLRSGASKAKTYDRLLRCVARDNRASDESDGLEGDSPVEYNLPSGEKACLEEERLWVAAFFCSTSDWLGRGDNASFVETARIVEFVLPTFLECLLTHSCPSLPRRGLLVTWSSRQLPTTSRTSSCRRGASGTTAKERCLISSKNRKPEDRCVLGGRTL